MIQNPILTGFNPDPSICRVGEDYYIAVSTFEWFPGVGIYHSKDLTNWTLVRRPLERLSQLNMIGNPNSGGVWAPCLTYSEGQFWLIYSDIKVVEGQWKDGHNYLVTATNIEDEWSEPIYLNSAGFDPSLYHDEDGKKYLLNMVWDARYKNHPFYGISIQEYDHEKKSLVGERKIIFKGTNAKLTEAPHLYKIDGYFYLLTAEGGTRYDHRATIARSSSIDGPYELSPHNPLITGFFTPEETLQKAGHASLVQTHTNEWYLAYLVGRPLQDENKPLLDPRGYCPLGRETAISKIEWKDGWPVVVGGNYPQLQVEAPAIAPQPIGDMAPTITYFKSELPLDFQTLRQPMDSFATLIERPGYLRLIGKESLTSKFKQAFVARRWQDFNFEAETKVNVSPTSFQQYAGLVNYYNTENWTALDITFDEKLGRVLTILSNDNTVFGTPLEMPIVLPEKGEVYLKVCVSANVYQYSYSLNGMDWIEVGPKFESYKLSDDYVQGGGFFTGAFVGMHCVDLDTQSLPANFEYFSYKPKKLE
ncbi:glycoside hydrolase family 43 protein [Solibacillus sp. FSL H8-0523]|uniref:glycoside hydrolase family 43 protein n=1 Tax=Solibacillus sp. FSL H8-0523 TaxID=2954511 RepID=UPI00310127FC